MKYSDAVKITNLVVDQDLNIIQTSDSLLNKTNLKDNLIHKHANTLLRKIKKGKRLEEDIKYAIDGDIYDYKMTVEPCSDSRIVTLVRLDRVIELQKSIKQLKKFAFNDQQTGLLNRYAYWKFLERHLIDAVRREKVIGVLFIDIDNLKKINSKDGYEAGDRAIERISQDIKKSSRKNDLIVRLGGDEFLMIFLLDPLKSFTVEDMCARVQARIRNSADGDNYSVSIGALTLKPGNIRPIVENIWNGKSWERMWKDLVSVADNYIKKAKKLGKNQAVIDNRILV